MDVILSKDSQKQFEHLPSSEQINIKKKLVALENNLLVGKKLAGELAQLRSLKAWPYRIIYYINKDKVFVTSIIHRQGAYQ